MTPHRKSSRGIARFEIGRALGEGADGVVYDARERATGARVALKELRRGGGAALYRFKHEFRVLADLSHPNLVRFLELFEDDGRYFLAMELVDGEDLRRYVRRSSAERDPLENGESLARTILPRAASAPAFPAASAISTETSRIEVVRLRDVLRQLASGLIALHSAGLVHRDIKPQNLLVTPAGRLVVLDFGLALDGRDAALRRAEFAGTLAYMAPEQAGAGTVSAASDWYAVGGVLYEALTGRLAFPGPSLQSLIERQSALPPPIENDDGELPEDLCALCMELLRPTPGDRPSGDEVARWLGVDPDAERRRVGFRSKLRHGSGPFVGRAHELSVLHEALERSREGRSVVVRVLGESGVGKTTVVRRFLEDVEHVRPDALVLSGRCYERETVAYAGVDSAIDALAGRLAAQEQQRRRPPIPANVDMLKHLFPVMGSIASLKHARGRPNVALDAFQARRLAFEALRELLASLAVTSPVVIHVDDAQWMGADSHALLSFLQKAEPMPVLFLLTQRSAPEVTPPEPRGTVAFADESSSNILLGPLSRPESQRLVQELVDLRRVANPIDVAGLARHSGGHPLFIHELVLHASHENAGALDVASALEARIGRLDPDARRLLEVVATAGAPIPHVVAGAAATLEPSVYSSTLSSLLSEQMVSSRALGADETVQVYHDRIREVWLERIGPDRRSAVHGRIAAALEELTPDALDSIAHHLVAAGDVRRGARCAVRAAEQAMSKLAFEHAERLLSMALALEPDSEPAHRARVESLLGQALANSGRSLDSAEAYLRASAASAGNDALELRRRAGEQLLRCGHVERGLDIVSSVLDELGEPVPRSRLALSASLASGLFRLHRRGLRMPEKKNLQLPEQTILSLEALWTMAAASSMIDTFAAAAFQVRYLSRALDLADVERCLKGMAILGSTMSLVDGAPRRFAERLLVTAHELGERAPSPEVDAWLALNAGIAAMSQGRFEECERSCHRAEAIFRERCTGVAWELVTARAFALWAMCYQGELKQIAGILPDVVDRARARGDRYALGTLLLGPLHMVGLAADEPERVRAECERELPSWSAPTAHFQKLCALFVLAQVDLYEGRPEAASERIDAEWGTLRQAMLLRAQFYRIDLLGLRARIAVARAARDDRERRRWLARASSDVAALSREPLGFARGTSFLIEGSLHLCGGSKEDAISALERAEAACAAEKMKLHEALARFARAEVEGDPERRDAASAVLAELGVRNVDRMLQLWVPGLRPRAL